MHQPSVDRRWRCCRFGLRSMLIVMTLVCVTLGIWIQRAVEQHRIVEHLEARGTTVFYDYQFEGDAYNKLATPRFGGWFSNDWRHHLFHSVVGIRIGAYFRTDTYDESPGPHMYDKEFLIDDDTWAMLKSLDEVTYLALNAANVSNDELRHVADMLRIEELALDSVPIDGDGLAHLANLPALRSLSLWGTRLSDENLDGLLKIRTLKSVSVGETFVTPKGAERVRQAMPNCKVNY